MVFHTLYRGQRDTRLFPLISYISLCCTLTFAPSRESYFTSLCHSSPLSPSDVAAAASRSPARSITTCPHRRIPNRAPGAFSNPPHRPNSDHAVMYCATMIFRRLIYSSIVKILPPYFLTPPRWISSSIPMSYVGAFLSSVSPPGSETPPCSCLCGGLPPRYPIRRAVPPVPRPWKRIRTPAAPLPPCYGCATPYSKPSLNGEIYSPPLASRHPLPISHAPGIWRRSPSPGGSHRHWKSWQWPPSTPPLLVVVSSSPLPGCTVMCACTSHSGTSTAPTCNKYAIYIRTHHVEPFK